MNSLLRVEHALESQLGPGHDLFRQDHGIDALDGLKQMEQLVLGDPGHVEATAGVQGHDGDALVLVLGHQAAHQMDFRADGDG